jgi:hypothetical protein
MILQCRAQIDKQIHAFRPLAPRLKLWNRVSDSAVGSERQLAIVNFFQILVQYWVFLDDVLDCGGPNRSAVGVVEFRLEIPRPKLGFGELRSLSSTNSARKKESPYFTWDVLAMCLCYHRVFVENLVYHLGSHNDFGFAIDGFRTRVDHLARLPLGLVLRGGKRQKEMLGALVEII